MFAALALAASLYFGPERHLSFTLTEPLPSLVFPVAVPTKDGYVVVFQTRQATFAQGVDREATRIRDDAALLDLSNTTRGAVAVASNGREVLATFVTNDGIVTRVISPRGVPTGTNQLLRRVGPVEVERLALVRISNRYLLISADIVVGTRGQFLHDDGTADGDSFPISDDEAITAASNGSTAFVFARKNRLSDASRAFLILPGGGVVQTGAIRDASFPALATWDGSAYVVALQDAILTFDSNGALARTQRLDLGSYHLYDLIGNGNGAALIAVKGIHGVDSDLSMIDLAPGGEISGPLRVIHSGFTRYSTAIFDVDHYLFLDNGTPVLADLGSRFDVRPVLALEAKTQWFPHLATAPSMSYVCWGELDGVHVARFRDGEFIGPSALAIAGDNPGLSQVIAADDDRALVVAVAGKGAGGRFVESDGSLSPMFLLPAPLRYPTGVLRVGSRWVVIAADDVFRSSWAVSLDDGGRVIDEVLLPSPTVRAAVAGGSLLYLTQNSAGDYQMTFADDAGRALQSITIGNGSLYGTRALVAGEDRALAIWQSDPAGTLHTAVIDLATRTVVASNEYESSFSGNESRVRGAWTGESFLLLDEGAHSLTLSQQGEIVGKGTVPTPIYASYPDLVPSGGSVLVAYTRSGADVGAGDRDRVFVRMLCITDGARAPREGDRPRGGSAPRP